jgi:hypothetical protein
MTAWWMSRSMAAAVVMGSLKIRSQSRKTRLLVMMTLVVFHALSPPARHGISPCLT